MAAARYGKNKKSIRSYEQEHWYVTNIDHISLKMRLKNGRILIQVIHDRTEHSFYLPDTTASTANNRAELDKKNCSLL